MSKRILHTMLRVGDLDRSINFYTNVLGMKLLRKSDNEEFEYTLAFIGYADESESAVIELTYNWDTSEYDLGNAYGHIAIGTDDIEKFQQHFLGQKFSAQHRTHSTTSAIKNDRMGLCNIVSINPHAPKQYFFLLLLLYIHLEQNRWLGNRLRQ